MRFSKVVIAASAASLCSTVLAYADCQSRVCQNSSLHKMDSILESSSVHGVDPSNVVETDEMIVIQGATEFYFHDDWENKSGTISAIGVNPSRHQRRIFIQGNRFRAIGSNFTGDSGSVLDVTSGDKSQLVIRNNRISGDASFTFSGNDSPGEMRCFSAICASSGDNSNIFIENNTIDMDIQIK